MNTIFFMLNMIYLSQSSVWVLPQTEANMSTNQIRINVYHIYMFELVELVVARYSKAPSMCHDITGLKYLPSRVGHQPGDNYHKASTDHSQLTERHSYTSFQSIWKQHGDSKNLESFQHLQLTITLPVVIPVSTFTCTADKQLNSNTTVHSAHSSPIWLPSLSFTVFISNAHHPTITIILSARASLILLFSFSVESRNVHESHQTCAILLGNQSYQLISVTSRRRNTAVPHRPRQLVSIHETIITYTQYQLREKCSNGWCFYLSWWPRPWRIFRTWGISLVRPTPAPRSNVPQSIHVLMENWCTL